MPSPAQGDLEGERLPVSLPPVIDAHIHVFARPLFEAIWRWFEQYGWPIRYKLDADAVVAFLRSRGVSGMVLLHYAHKPGIARAMNAFVAEVARRTPTAVGVATVHPDDLDPAAILAEGFAMGLRGVKLHCHVQCFGPDDARLDAIEATWLLAEIVLVRTVGQQAIAAAMITAPVVGSRSSAPPPSSSGSPRMRCFQHCSPSF